MAGHENRPSRSRPVGRGPYSRQLKVWLVLLCLAELADLITTRADRLHGGIEVNQVAAFTLSVGSPGLFWVLELSLVVVMAAIALLAALPGCWAAVVLEAPRRSG